MTRFVRRAVQLVAGLALAGCQAFQDDLPGVLGSPTARAREARLTNSLTDRDSAVADSTPLAQWLLPPGLQEISGLALTSDGRLLVHDDELGQVWEIDYRRGVLVKRFSLGKGNLTGDFEGITVANDVVYMVSGKGGLYEFREGANHARVSYVLHGTGLEKECAFEGIAFDAAINSLLLACKLVLNKDLEDSLVIFRWNLAAHGARLSKLTVPLAGIIGANDWKNVQPADITVDPLTGNYVLVASTSKEKALISITPQGAVVFVRTLPALHHQPEGLAITKDSILIVSDEAATPPAILTLYRWL
jgi:uncharacterized protein YjiK